MSFTKNVRFLKLYFLGDSKWLSFFDSKHNHILWWMCFHLYEISFCYMQSITGWLMLTGEYRKLWTRCCRGRVHIWMRVRYKFDVYSVVPWHSPQISELTGLGRGLKIESCGYLWRSSGMWNVLEYREKHLPRILKWS